ncbi:MAG: M28 family peptidase, partial [Flammeovirgaceae bacterium]|nr:M28 family peptidase [Flammeovirgaceae bacterium]MDW8287789.1 M28 family peptidase [Flammeovirgaceae bacterium]
MKKYCLFIVAYAFNWAFSCAQLAELKGLSKPTETFYAPEDLQKYKQTITAEDLKNHLSILASDDYEGRETGTKGQKMAAEYIQKKFQQLGLEGPVKTSENPFYQTFQLTKATWNDGYIETKNQKMLLFEDFFPYGDYSTSHQKIEIVFAGYGIHHEKYSDYKGLNVKGKGVVILRGEPKDAQGNYLLTGTKNDSGLSTTLHKMKYARQHGALFIINIYDSDEEFRSKNAMYRQYYMQPTVHLENENRGKVGFFFTSPTNAAYMLGITPNDFQEKLKKWQAKGTYGAGKLKSTITLSLDRKKAPLETENVLGFLQGTDLKDEILIITSHYDHIGIGSDGQINNGADDDGSGTVALLEIAEAFAEAAAEGKRPRRSILFMTVTGEEKGLLGSEYYASNPLFPLANTIANLNIDMIGRTDDRHKDGKPYVYIIGSDMLSSDLHRVHEAVASEFANEVELDYFYNSKDSPERFYYRSDHYNFAKHGIPIIFYFNGTHPDYHRPTDDVDKINFDLLAQRTKL